jgi:hypothetical protein
MKIQTTKQSQKRDHNSQITQEAVKAAARRIRFAADLSAGLVAMEAVAAYRRTGREPAQDREGHRTL